MKKTTKEREPILTLKTRNWNTTPKKEQDKALLNMLEVLAELSQNRKFGFCKDFYAEFGGISKSEAEQSH